MKEEKTWTVTVVAAAAAAAGDEKTDAVVDQKRQADWQYRTTDTSNFQPRKAGPSLALDVAFAASADPAYHQVERRLWLALLLLELPQICRPKSEFDNPKPLELTPSVF